MGVQGKGEGGRGVRWWGRRVVGPVEIVGDVEPVGAVEVVVVVGGVELVAVVGYKGGEGAANTLWDGGRSYGGPKREGRLVMKRGEHWKRRSEGKRLGVNGARERGRERKR